MREKKKIVIIVCIAVAVIVLAIVGYNMILNAEEESMEKELAQKYEDEEIADNEDPWPDAVPNTERHFLMLNDEIYVYSDDIKTYLIFGTDKGVGQKYPTGEELGGMADMFLVLVVNNTRKEYSMLHINRDTLTVVPMLGPVGEELGYYYGQICIAHAYGATEDIRCENTSEVVSHLLGDVTIDGYAMLMQDSIKVINAAVGGVTVTIPEDLTDVDPEFVEGVSITLDDDQAERFVRARMDVGDGHNSSRMERQKLYLSGLQSKLQDASSKNSEFVSNLYNSLESVMYNNISGKQVSELAEVMKNYSNRGTFKFEGVTVEYFDRLGDSQSHDEFTIDQNSYLEVMKALYHVEKYD